MTRCSVHQVTLSSDSTCISRLAWLDRYDRRTKSMVNSMSAGGDRERAEEYAACRKCRGVGKEVQFELPVKKPKGKWAGKSCTTNASHGEVYAGGVCRICYNRAYRNGGFQKHVK